ncbi:universal stress protein [Streptomyces kunmingensis]|uniref:Universal stress protein n=1 Tax=Streptomyces kunmingensis TaxID=68225 RepID=A0ABU6CB90_9ACTN|nr:universal stress protein [Streptomyces kunmingensis]MEB3961635.1 universal stress protein [Streptomyces kunmingensis]
MYEEERGPGRVVAGVGGSPASRAALRSAADEARRSARPLVAVLAWEPPEGEAMYRRRPDAQWARHWCAAAREELTRAVAETLGPSPRGLDLSLRVVRDRPGPALLALASRPGDLLVIGVRGRRAAVHRYVRRHALCPVLSVPVRSVRRAERRTLRRMTPGDFCAP